MQSSYQRLVWRALVILICAAAAWGAAVSAIVTITAASNPNLALQLKSNDPVALAVRVDADLSKPNISQRVLLAKSGDVEMALRGQAMNAGSLRQLALIADARNKTDDARTLMQLSAKISRRDFAAQLWLIEDGVRANNIVSTMAHYDVALRTSAASAAILHPILNAAIVDETVQRALVPYLRTNPPWLASFLTYAIVDGTTPVALAETIMKAGRLPDTEVYRAFDTQLLQLLAAKGNFAEMFRYYRGLKGAEQRVITSTLFDVPETAPQYAPITWQALSSPGIDATLEAPENQSFRQFRVIASSGERAPALRKLLGYSPGVYRFSQNSLPVRLTNGASAYWQMLCLKDASLSVIWRSDVDDELVIPATCAGQYLEYVIAGGSDQDGAEVIVKSVSLSMIKPI
jgi:hypothetical protein